MRAAIATLAAGAALALPSAAPAAVQTVSVQFSTFGPGQLDVLPGETVAWQNVSDRRHTVNADDGSFASGDLFSGDTFSREFDAVGLYAYHCTVHPGMVGEVDVRRVTLGPLPTAAIPAGTKVSFEGRSADPGEPVRIERAEGASFKTIAGAMPAADGSWSAAAIATQTGDYRAASSQGVSESRRLLVSDRKILVRATRRGVVVNVTPSLPYGQVVLQQYLRERFGWWPRMSARLDYVSQATFRVRRPARLRVVLVAKDGWTPIVTSRVLVLGHGGRAAGPAPAAGHHPQPHSP
jgi:plastocyanin